MKKNKNLPTHIAIIPDGNRRWAKKHKLDAWLGHKKGSESLDMLADVIIELNISHLSFWGSSQDNLIKRPKEEVKFLLSMFKKNFLELSENKKIHDNKIKINIFGSWKEQFPEDVCLSLNTAINSTKNYNNYFLNFFLAYSGTSEALNAIKCIARRARKDASLEIDRNLLKSCLLTRDLPSVDLMVRTGGEPHLSDGFMMWDTANTQLYFSEKLWPDFNQKDLRDAIKDYSSRSRRFGK
ncbi:MAG: di-trans,poly-cis-decaprenylcistransferase [Candidatus Pacebacteria bacterium]|nr:di-trans,poly-cis-decaprenylcistransferase [Candidatus Paceibacterota bacterium]